jgi:hypothetical protein
MLVRIFAPYACGSGIPEVSCTSSTGHGLWTWKMNKLVWGATCVNDCIFIPYLTNLRCSSHKSETLYTGDHFEVTIRVHVTSTNPNSNGLCIVNLFQMTISPIIDFWRITECSWLQHRCVHVSTLSQSDLHSPQMKRDSVQNGHELGRQGKSNIYIPIVQATRNRLKSIECSVNWICDCPFVLLGFFPFFCTDQDYLEWFHHTGLPWQVDSLDQEHLRHAFRIRWTFFGKRRSSRSHRLLHRYVSFKLLN